ncbi:methyltransferase [Candidatus Woesearchaeota archaeon]|nr:methyltransferase [Candidatus Woesearchaeota archaeon]
MKVIIDSKGNKHYWDGGDLHTSFGVIKEKYIRNGVVKSHLGKEFIVFDGGFVDKINKIKRGPAIMLPKDIGLILSYTGINSKSKVVDAGSGCGVLAGFLGNISKKVTSYEKNKDFFNLAKKNLEFLGIKVKLKNKDIYEGIDENDLDLITLDLNEPWKVLKHAKKSLKSGGFLVCYLPNINQVDLLVKEAMGFYVEKVLENIEREWIVDDIRLRPKNLILGHTGFLVFLRNI